MYRNQYRWIQIFLILIECIIAVVAFILAGILRFGNLGTFLQRIDFNEMLLIVVLASSTSFILSGMYKNFFHRGYLHEFNRVVIYSTAIISIVSIYVFATKNDAALSRLTLLYFYIINNVLVYLANIGIKRLNANYRRGAQGKKLLVITDIASLAGTCRNLKKANMQNSVIGAYVLDHTNEDLSATCDIPLIDPPMGIINYIVQNPIDEVLLSIDEGIYLTDEVQTIRDEVVKSGSIFSLRIWHLVPDEPFVTRLTEFGNDYILSFANRSYSYSSIQIKRAMDILAGIIGSVITLLLSVFLVPAILIESPGPVFFKQKRIGRNGRIFTILKFRSMYKDAEERKAKLMERNKMKGPLFKLDHDPRVTKVGRFIRKTSLDEFPQFFNVLVGDMSVVGTRPPTLDEFKQYNATYKKRLSFRPGITGIWQTSGRNEITDFESILKMDLEYIRDWSIYLDVKLILKTVWVVLFGKGAA